MKLVLSLIAALTAAPALAETWRIGTEADYAPYIFYDAAGALTGLDKELGDLICARAKVTCIWTEVAFDALFTGLAADQFDIVMAGVGSTPARLDLADFSIPYRDTGQNTGVFAGLTEGIGIDDAVIGVQSGTNFEAWLTMTGRMSQGYATNEAAIKALLARDVDLVFGSGSYFQHAFETDYPQLRSVGQEQFPSTGTSIAVRKGNTDLLGRIDTILAALRADGSVKAIEDRWFVDGDPV